MFYRSHVTQEEYDRIVAEGAEYEAKGTPPHCNPDVVHAPGRCAFCDGQPKRQALRVLSGKPFTPDEANGWGGNVAVSVDEDKAREELQALADLTKELGRRRRVPRKA